MSAVSMPTPMTLASNRTIALVSLSTQSDGFSAVFDHGI
jgi:hypothetical protein